MTDSGVPEYVRRGLQITSIADESEAFYLRVYGAGEYCYHGADLGVLLTRGRRQTDRRTLTDRARQWNAGIKSQFLSTPIAPDVTKPAYMTDAKWF